MGADVHERRATAPAAENIAGRTAETCRIWLESNIGLVGQRVRAVCRAARMSGDDEAEFTASVYLKLVSGDYGVLRQFGGRSSIATFLQVVIRRHLADWRNERWGRWRPSTTARRIGDAAVHLERLTVRDGLSVGEAVRVLSLQDRWGLSSAQWHSLHQRLPVRVFGRRLEALAVEIASEDAECEITHRELERDAARVRQGLATALRSLSPDDRQLLRLRFREGLTVADIARERGVEAKALYRHITRVLGDLRAHLEQLQVSASSVRPMVGHPAVSLAVDGPGDSRPA